MHSIVQQGCCLLASYKERRPWINHLHAGSLRFPSDGLDEDLAAIDPAPILLEWYIDVGCCRFHQRLDNGF